ncbi:MAG: ABC transporter substrate-binding protein, partial [Chloroflexota bacterium]
AVGAVLAACGAGGEGGPPAASARPADLRVHLVKKTDVSDWIEQGLEQNVEDWKGRYPNVNVTIELHGTWTSTYFPQVIALAASGQMGDVVWYPGRHRSHLSWGTKYGIVRDLLPIMKAAKYNLGQFYKGAIEQNTWEGKQYWLPYISEPTVPVIAYNKAKISQLGLQPPKDDWTFDELAEWAKRGTTTGGTGAVWGYYRGDSGTNPHSGAPYLRQWGVEPVDKTGTKVTLMDHRQAFVNALTFRYNLMNVWKVSPNPKDVKINQAELFGKEQRLLAADIWPFRIQVYPKDFPDMQIDFALTPTVKKGDKRRSRLNEHVLGVTTASTFPEEAFAFVAWATGKEMSAQGLIQGFKGPTSRADLWNDPRITDRWPTYKKLKPIVETIEPDFFVANFRGEEFDSAFAPWSRMERSEIPVLEAANEIVRLAQAVLDKEPA